MDIENEEMDLSLPFDEANNLVEYKSSTGISKINDSTAKKKKHLTFQNEVEIGGSNDRSIGVDDDGEKENDIWTNMGSKNKPRRFLIDSVGVGSISTPTLGGSRLMNSGLKLNETPRPKSDGGRSYVPTRQSNPLEVYDEPFPKSFQKYKPIRLSACKRSLPTLQEYTYYDANFISPSVSLNYLITKTQSKFSPHTRFLLDKLDGVVYNPPAENNEDDEDVKPESEDEDSTCACADEDEDQGSAFADIESEICHSPGNLVFNRLNKSAPNLKWDTSEEYQDQDQDLDSQSDNENESTTKYNFSECSLNLPKINENEEQDLEDAVNVKPTY